jgi:PPOX class probable F420-dependent enzyme
MPSAAGRLAFVVSTIIPDTHADLLHSAALAHLATHGPNDTLQSTPIWFQWDGEHVKFSITTGRQKYRNIQRDPHVALSICDPANPYRYLEVRGTVVRIEPDPDLAYINSSAKKYMGHDEYPFHQPGDERVVVYVRPERTSTMG